MLAQYKFCFVLKFLSKAFLDKQNKKNIDNNFDISQLGLHFHRHIIITITRNQLIRIFHCVCMLVNEWTEMWFFKLDVALMETNLYCYADQFM